MTEDDQADFENASCCHICQMKFYEKDNMSEITITERDAIVGRLTTGANSINFRMFAQLNRICLEKDFFIESDDCLPSHNQSHNVVVVVG